MMTKINRSQFLHAFETNGKIVLPNNKTPSLMSQLLDAKEVIRLEPPSGRKRLYEVVDSIYLAQYRKPGCLKSLFLTIFQWLKCFGFQTEEDIYKSIQKMRKMDKPLEEKVKLYPDLLPLIRKPQTNPDVVLEHIPLKEIAAVFRKSATIAAKKEDKSCFLLGSHSNDEEIESTCLKLSLEQLHALAKDLFTIKDLPGGTLANFAVGLHATTHTDEEKRALLKDAIDALGSQLSKQLDLANYNDQISLTKINNPMRFDALMTFVRQYVWMACSEKELSRRSELLNTLRAERNSMFDCSLSSKNGFDLKMLKGQQEIFLNWVRQTKQDFLLGEFSPYFHEISLERTVRVFNDIRENPEELKKAIIFLSENKEGFRAGAKSAIFAKNFKEVLKKASPEEIAKWSGLNLFELDYPLRGGEFHNDVWKTTLIYENLSIGKFEALLKGSLPEHKNSSFFLNAVYGISRSNLKKAEKSLRLERLIEMFGDEFLKAMFASLDFSGTDDKIFYDKTFIEDYFQYALSLKDEGRCCQLLAIAISAPKVMNYVFRLALISSKTEMVPAFFEGVQSKLILWEKFISWFGDANLRMNFEIMDPALNTEVGKRIRTFITAYFHHTLALEDVVRRNSLLSIVESSPRVMSYINESCHMDEDEKKRFDEWVQLEHTKRSGYLETKPKAF